MDDGRTDYTTTHWAWSYVDGDGFHSVIEFSPDGLIEDMAVEFGANGSAIFDNGTFCIFSLRNLVVPKEVLAEYDEAINDDSSYDRLCEQCPDLEPWLMRRPFYAAPPIATVPQKSKYIVFGGAQRLGFGILVYDFPALLVCVNKLTGLC